MVAPVSPPLLSAREVDRETLVRALCIDGDNIPRNMSLPPEALPCTGKAHRLEYTRPACSCPSRGLCRARLSMGQWVWNVYSKLIDVGSL